jgi:ketosteroid isomerase-like protein
MEETTSRSSAEAEIRARIDERMRAVREKDVGRAMACMADDVVTFDVVNVLRYTGADDARKRAEEWFATFDGPIGFEMRELVVAAGGDVAFSHSLNHYSGTVTAGALDMWVRVTTGWRRTAGRWTIVHEHNSAPFDTSTWQPIIGQQP